MFQAEQPALHGWRFWTCIITNFASVPDTTAYWHSSQKGAPPSSQKKPSQAGDSEKRRRRIEDDFDGMQRGVIRHSGTIACFDDRLTGAFHA
jgi:hypothetical protein